MIRSIVGVIIGFIAAFAISAGLFFGMWFALGVDGVLKKGVFEGNTTLNIGAPLFSILGGLIGGLLCAKISRSCKAVLTLAVISLILVGLSGFMDQQRPAPPNPRPEGLTVMEAIMQGKPPLWFSVVNPIITAGAMMLGGRCSACKKKTA